MINTGVNRGAVVSSLEQHELVIQPSAHLSSAAAEAPLVRDELHDVGKLPTGPLSKMPVLVPRLRRGGRPPSGKERVKRQRRPMGPQPDPATRRQDTALTRRLKACTRCERQRIRCIPDHKDPIGPCLTCIRSKSTCPRFESLSTSSSTKIRELLPHTVDIYRVHVESLDCNDKRRLYILENTEMSALGSLNLQFADLEVDMNRFFHGAIVPLLLVTFNTKNHGDAENLKWDALQLAYKLGFNPLRTGNLVVLRQFFHLWVMIATYDLILPAIQHTGPLYKVLEDMIRNEAVQLFRELGRLLKQDTDDSRFIIHLALYIHSLCSYSGISAPADCPLPFHHIRIITQLFEAYRSRVRGIALEEKDIVEICRIPSSDVGTNRLQPNLSELA